MKKLIFALCALPLLMAAQTPFGKNATWHFEYSAFGFTGFKKVKYEKDTTINSSVWQKFTVTGLSELKTGANPNDLIQDTNAVFDDVLLSSRNDSVFYFNAQGDVKLLFDFTAGVGDKWNFANAVTSAGCFQMPEATVISIGYDTVNGHALKYWEIENPMDTFIIQNQPVYMCASGYCLPTKIYENIGCFWYSELFNPSPNICNGNVFNLAYNQMRCFSNPIFSVNFTNKNCDYWSLIGLEEENLTSFKIYPNPSSGWITIEASQPVSSVEVYDLTGRLLAVYEKQTTLELPQQSGLYLLNVSFKNGEKVVQKVIRE